MLKEPGWVSVQAQATGLAWRQGEGQLQGILEAGVKLSRPCD